MLGKVCVIGGGISGITSAILLQKKGFEVTLIEARNRLGGRLCSYYNSVGLSFDNGKHILAGWYNKTLELISILGTSDKLIRLRGLRTVFIEKDGKHSELFISNNFIFSFFNILKFKKLSLKDILNLVFFLRTVKKNNIKKEFLRLSVRDLLFKYKQTLPLFEYFWNPFVISVFNTIPERLSSDIFLNVLNEGFKNSDNLDLILFGDSIDDIFINPFIKYAEKNNIRILKSSKIEQIIFDDKLIKKIIINGKVQNSYNYYVLSVSSQNLSNIFIQSKIIPDIINSFDFKYNSIMNIHIFYKNIPDEYLKNKTYGMFGIINGLSHWWFFHKSLISVVISCPELSIKDYSLLSNEKLKGMVLNELSQRLKWFDINQVSDIKLLKDKKATFVSEIGTSNFRPENSTLFKNLFITGDFTNTGFPSTIESAVKSAYNMTEKICESR